MSLCDRRVIMSVRVQDGHLVMTCRHQSPDVCNVRCAFVRENKTWLSQMMIPASSILSYVTSPTTPDVWVAPDASSVHVRVPSFDMWLSIEKLLMREEH